MWGPACQTCTPLSILTYAIGVAKLGVSDTYLLSCKWLLQSGLTITTVYGML